MGRFKFSTTSTSMLGGIRVNDEVHHKIKSIAAHKNITIQEVTRVLIEVGLEEFEKEYPEQMLQLTNPTEEA
jgi:ABC-type nitrate/sulfonate/bicarbonate transport system ATPase subunit